MTDPTHADALLTALICGTGETSFEGFATLTDGHEREKALRMLLALLTDPDLRLREYAIKALGVMGDQRAVDAIINSFVITDFDIDLDEDILFAQFEALATLGDPQAIMPMLKYRSPRIRMIANRNVRKFDQEIRLRVLGDAVNHPDDIIRKNVIDALGHIRDPRSIKLLIEALSDKESSVRYTAAFYLGELRATEAVPFLLMYAADNDWDVRMSTAIALGQLMDQQAIPSLLPLLNDEYQQVRISAALALWKLGDSGGADVILTYLAKNRRPYETILDDALKAFKTLHVPAEPLVVDLAYEVLAEMPGKHSTLILIAEIFAEQPDPAALPVLERMLKSDNEAVRQVAQQAIDAIKAQQGGKEQ